MVQELLEHVRLPLSGHEHEHSLPLHALRQEHVDEHAALLAAVARVQDLLHDRVRGRAHAAYGQRGKVALQEVLCTKFRTLLPRI